mmetsp:Transcript_88249/g.172589  ORF Transcript_88249/g.172589 Transcript_88249/m.172589 type:complete len:233 (-) Transcript_88249:520-1218(-)
MCVVNTHIAVLDSTGGHGLGAQVAECVLNVIGGLIEDVVGIHSGALQAAISLRGTGSGASGRSGVCAHLAHAIVVAKVGHFVHINPQTIRLAHVPEGLQLRCPVVLALRVKEIREISRSGPHLPHIPSSLHVLDEQIFLHALIIGSVALLDENSRINNWDKVLTIGVQLAHERRHLCLREVHTVESEVLVVLHVVDVHPLSVQGNASSRVSRNHFLHLIDACVPVLAVVEAQ